MPVRFIYQPLQSEIQYEVVAPERDALGRPSLNGDVLAQYLDDQNLVRVAIARGSKLFLETYELRLSPGSPPSLVQMQSPYEIILRDRPGFFSSIFGISGEPEFDYFNMDFSGDGVLFGSINQPKRKRAAVKFFSVNRNTVTLYRTDPLSSADQECIDRSSNFFGFSHENAMAFLHCGSEGIRILVWKQSTPGHPLFSMVSRPMWILNSNYLVKGPFQVETTVMQENPDTGAIRTSRGIINYAGDMNQVNLQDDSLVEINERERRINRMDSISPDGSLYLKESVPVRGVLKFEVVKAADLWPN